MGDAVTSAGRGIAARRLARVAGELHLRPAQVRAAAALLADGATVPFIARHRKEATGSLDEVAIAAIRDRLAQLEALDLRRAAITASLQERGLLTDEVRASLDGAETLAELEDACQPFRPRRRTRASVARERGLEPLADILLRQDPRLDPAREAARFVTPADRPVNDEQRVPTPEVALQGTRDIIAERSSDDPATCGQLRRLFRQQGTVRAEVRAGQGGVPGPRHHPPRRGLHRATAAGPARRAGEDRSPEHRRGPVPARRRPGRAQRRARRGGRLVCQRGRRGGQHRVERAAGVRVGTGSTPGRQPRPLPQRARPVHRPARAARGAPAGQQGVRAGGRLPAHPWRGQPPGCPGRPPGGLSSGGAHGRRPQHERARADAARGAPPAHRPAAVRDGDDRATDPGGHPRRAGQARPRPAPGVCGAALPPGRAIEDLRPGMRLPGIVTNVIAFGAFVDIGVHQDGLVHISQLADRFVRDPNEVVRVQQVVEVTVLEVDLGRRRVALSRRGTVGQRVPR